MLRIVLISDLRWPTSLTVASSFVAALHPGNHPKGVKSQAVKDSFKSMIDRNRSSKKGRFREIDCVVKIVKTLNTTLDRSSSFPASTK